MTKTKLCKKCDTVKSIDDFYKKYADKEARRYICKKCDSLNKKKYEKTRTSRLKKNMSEEEYKIFRNNRLKYNKKYSTELTDYYITQQITKRSTLVAKDVTPMMIEIKRRIIKLTRDVRNNKTK